MLELLIIVFLLVKLGAGFGWWLLFVICLALDILMGLAS